MIRQFHQLKLHALAVKEAFPDLDFTLGIPSDDQVAVFDVEELVDGALSHLSGADTVPFIPVPELKLAVRAAGQDEVVVLKGCQVPHDVDVPFERPNQGT